MDYKIIQYRGHYAVVDCYGNIECEVDSYREAREEIALLEERR